MDWQHLRNLLIPVDGVSARLCATGGNDWYQKPSFLWQENINTYPPHASPTVPGLYCFSRERWLSISLHHFLFSVYIHFVSPQTSHIYWIYVIHQVSHSDAFTAQLDHRETSFYNFRVRSLWSEVKMLSSEVSEKRNMRFEGRNEQLYMLASMTCILKVWSCVAHKQIRPNKSK